MEKWKKIINKILYPPLWLIILLTAISIATLPFIFIKGWEEMPVAYPVYVVAFYTFSVLCLFFADALPKRYKEIKQRIYENPLGNKYMTDVVFKVRISLYISFAINLVYSAFHLFSGIFYSSLWIGAVAIYYVLLSVIRFILLQHMEKKKDGGMISEYQSYKISAILMMLLNLTLSGIVLNMIIKNEVIAYSDIYVITSATYTFYILTMSIVDIVRYRKYNSPVMSAAKAIRFAQALVSLLSLEATMLVQFGDDESFRRTMLALTGAGVFLIVLTMSVYMIIRATRQIKKENR